MSDYFVLCLSCYYKGLIIAWLFAQGRFMEAAILLLAPE